jgi:hypothetical protein
MSLFLALLDELAVNPGLAAIWEDEKQRRREEGRTSQITPRSSQDRPFAPSTESEVFFKQRLHEKLGLLNSQVCNTNGVLYFNFVYTVNRIVKSEVNM